MTSFRPLIFLFLLLSLPGCAYLHSLDTDLPRQIDSWIKADEYGKALDTLYYIQSEHKDYAVLMQKKEFVQKCAVEFEKGMLKKGEQLVADKNWHAALQTYDYGLDKLPQSRPLQKARKRFLEKRERELNYLKIKLLQNKTDWLLNNAALYEQRLHITPNNRTARWSAKDHAEEVDKTATALVDCAKEALDQGELKMGQQCVHIAKQLTPSSDIQLGIAHIEQQLSREIAFRSRKLSRQGRQSLAKAHLALAKADFGQAKEIINKLPLTDGKNQKILAFRKELDETIQDYVEVNIVEGQKLYSAGKIDQAYSLWQSLKPLAPDNDKLDELISRVERVLKKLQQINDVQEKSGTG